MDAFLFGRKYLNSEGLAPSLPATVRIKSVSVEILQDGSKLAVEVEDTKGRFAGKVILNATNRQALVAALGRETDGWIGKEVGLRVEPVLFKGAQVQALRFFAA